MKRRAPTILETPETLETTDVEATFRIEEEIATTDRQGRMQPNIIVNLDLGNSNTRSEYALAQHPQLWNRSKCSDNGQIMTVMPSILGMLMPSENEQEKKIAEYWVGYEALQKSLTKGGRVKLVRHPKMLFIPNPKTSVRAQQVMEQKEIIEELNISPTEAMRMVIIRILDMIRPYSRHGFRSIFMCVPSAWPLQDVATVCATVRAAASECPQTPCEVEMIPEYVATLYGIDDSGLSPGDYAVVADLGDMDMVA